MTKIIYSLGVRAEHIKEDILANLQKQPVSIANQLQLSIQQVSDGTKFLLVRRLGKIQEEQSFSIASFSELMVKKSAIYLNQNEIDLLRRYFTEIGQMDLLHKVEMLIYLGPNEISIQEY